MAASVACDPERLTGYRREQLAAAFERVRNPQDWKAPIQAVIPAAEWHLVEKAVLWFTATVPKFLPVPGTPDQLVVKAPGYRLGPAGNSSPSFRQQDEESMDSTGRGYSRA
jgi:hypothetical protein